VRERYKSISPEVEHLLAAVKAVKRGLLPEKSKLPLPEDELDNEEVVLDEEDRKV
jgi:hypothetical protein